MNKKHNTLIKQTKKPLSIVINSWLGTHVHPWQIRVNVWFNKELKKKNEKEKEKIVINYQTQIHLFYLWNKNQIYQIKIFSRICKLYKYSRLFFLSARKKYLELKKTIAKF